MSEIDSAFEPGAAKYVGLPVGASRYPFATEHQFILWGREDATALHQHLSERLARLEATA